MDKFDKAALTLGVFIIVLPQLYLIATASNVEAVAGRMAFAVIPLMFGCLWIIGWVGRTIERIVKGRG